MSETIQRYPLQWPAGWRRTEPHARERAKFGKGERQYSNGGTSTWIQRKALTINEALHRVLAELERMGIHGDDVVISSNLRVRLDGMPASGQANPDDCGVAVYWRNGAGTRCMAIDRYDRVQDNIAAIAATLGHMRGIDRHGGATIMDRAFQGFVALPAPRAWWQVLELNGPNPSPAEIEHAHRRLISKHHPDKGGDVELAADINAARDQGLEAIQ
jgi:hypothetical protein